MKNLKKPKRVQTNHRLLPDIIKAVEMRAETSGMNARQVVELILSQGLASELQAVKERREVVIN